MFGASILLLLACSGLVVQANHNSNSNANSNSNVAHGRRRPLLPVSDDDSYEEPFSPLDHSRRRLNRFNPPTDYGENSNMNTNVNQNYFRRNAGRGDTNTLPLRIIKSRRYRPPPPSSTTTRRPLSRPHGFTNGHGHILHRSGFQMPSHADIMSRRSRDPNYRRD